MWLLSALFFDLGGRPPHLFSAGYLLGTRLILRTNLAFILLVFFNVWCSGIPLFSD